MADSQLRWLRPDRAGADLGARTYAVERLYLAAAFAGVVYGAFFLALATMAVYGGSTYDTNGYQPFTLRIGRPRPMDLNVSAFSVMSVLLIAGAALISRGVG